MNMVDNEQIKTFQLNSLECDLEFWVRSLWCKGCEARVRGVKSKSILVLFSNPNYLLIF